VVENFPKLGILLYLYSDGYHSLQIKSTLNIMENPMLTGKIVAIIVLLQIFDLIYTLIIKMFQ